MEKFQKLGVIGFLALAVLSGCTTSRGGIAPQIDAAYHTHFTTNAPVLAQARAP